MFDSESRRFCAVLDGTKSGLVLKPERIEADRKLYKRRPAAWRETDEDKKIYELTMSNELNLRRGEEVKEIAFIMDVIKLAGERKRDDYLAEFEERLRMGEPKQFDDHLAEPWYKTLDRAQRATAQGTASHLVTRT